MSPSEGRSTVDYKQQVNAPVDVEDLEQWAQQMAEEMLKNLRPGDAVEWKIKVDFTGVSKTLSKSEKKRLMDKILENI